jgi:hypothetical protein
MSIEQRVRELKQIIAGNDGRNAADGRFTRAVDELIVAVYDDIGEVSALPARTLFDLFVIKVLYVGRHSRDAAVIDYIGALLETYLDVRKLFPPDEEGRLRRLYFSDMVTGNTVPTDEPNVYEGYRRYADSALFLTGVFPTSLRRRARERSVLRRRTAAAVDRGYYVSTGKEMYRMAAQHDHEGCAHDPATLAKLGANFELYADALNEMSERYITGVPQTLIADKMLDAMNRHRTSCAARDLDAARRYAALIDLRPFDQG